ncbi:KRI1-like family C-terminal [Popillia japonica]|uniref:Protein KRI1 homolog n=1 Tax=Popillia japonica TaxID=7064 RepID=A0AAW1JDS8_POPJA
MIITDKNKLTYSRRFVNLLDTSLDNNSEWVKSKIMNAASLDEILREAKVKTKYGEELFDQPEASASSSEDDEESVDMTGEMDKDFFKALASLKNKDPKIYDENVMTGEMDKDFFKALASLKNKDPKIYDENVTFFSEPSESRPTKSKSKEQPMFIKDYERKQLLEKGGQIDSSDDEISQPTNTLTYVEEQEKLKTKLKDALQTVEDSVEEEWGGMFKSRNKTVTELKQEEEEYLRWLKGQNEDVDDNIKKDLKPLKDYWNDPKLEENEKFLESDNNDYVPTYDEIIHDSDDGFSEDEKEIDKQEEFEHKYNYRFEEPDEEFIKRYPRTIESSLRRKDDKRKLKRTETKERKQKEKLQKMEEIKQMQMLRKKEIEEKIQKLKEITGNDEIGFNDKDIEEDFDPEAHDRKMQQLFNDEYYHAPEEAQKPEFSDDEMLELEQWEKYEPDMNTETNINEPHCEDDDFNMDCDYDPAANDVTKTEKRQKKRKRRTKFAEVLSEPKPTFNPENKTYQEYLDEYYKLECEDIIGDIPCRFKYRKVVPNNFGLSIEEILMANDRELNKWCSLKKAVQYRPDHVEKYDVIAFDKKGKNENLKRKILPSLFKDPEECESRRTTSTQSVNNELSKEFNVNKNKRPKPNTLPNSHDEIEEKNIIPSSNGTTDGYVNTYKKNKIENKVNLSTEPTDVVGNAITKNTNPTSKKKKHKKSKPATKYQTPTDHSTKIIGNCNIDDNTIIRNQQHTRKKKGNTLKVNGNPQQSNSNELDISDARLKAFGFKPKKFKNKMKYGQKNLNAKVKI